MAPSGQLTASALQALLQDEKLAGSWTLDASKSQIGLRSKSVWGMVSVKGFFRQFTGEGTVSPAGEVTGPVTVDAASIDTKNPKRDTLLRSDVFFDVGNHPSIVVRVDSIKPGSAAVTVTG